MGGCISKVMSWAKSTTKDKVVHEKVSPGTRHSRHLRRKLHKKNLSLLKIVLLKNALKVEAELLKEAGFPMLAIPPPQPVISKPVIHVVEAQRIDEDSSGFKYVCKPISSTTELHFDVKPDINQFVKEIHRNDDESVLSIRLDLPWEDGEKLVCFPKNKSEDFSLDIELPEQVKCMQERDDSTFEETDRDVALQNIAY